MTMHTLGDSGRYLSKEYHRKRDEARQSLGSFEWGPIDTTRYDLDNLKFDRKSRAYATDPDLEKEGTPKSGHLLYKPGYMRNGVGEE